MDPDPTIKKKPDPDPNVSTLRADHRLFFLHTDVTPAVRLIDICFAGIKFRTETVISGSGSSLQLRIGILIFQNDGEPYKFYTEKRVENINFSFFFNNFIEDINKKCEIFVQLKKIL